MMDAYSVEYSVDAFEDLRGMHQLLVDNFIVYYLVDDKDKSVTIVRIFYGRRDVERIVNTVE